MVPPLAPGPSSRVRDLTPGRADGGGGGASAPDINGLIGVINDLSRIAGPLQQQAQAGQYAAVKRVRWCLGRSASSSSTTARSS